MTEAERRAAVEALEAMDIAMLPLSIKPDMRAVLRAADAIANAHAAIAQAESHQPARQADGGPPSSACRRSEPLK